MNTKFVYGGIVAIAIGGLIWQMAGFAALFAVDGPGDRLDSSQDIKDKAENSTLKDGVEGSAKVDDGNIVGLVISGIGRIFTMVSLVVTYPAELINLGLPYWAAEPLGTLTTVLASIGLVQFFANRVLR